MFYALDPGLVQLAGHKHVRCSRALIHVQNTTAQLYLYDLLHLGQCANSTPALVLRMRSFEVVRPAHLGHRSASHSGLRFVHMVIVVCLGLHILD